jgi:hypothetical protein
MIAVTQLYCYSVITIEDTTAPVITGTTEIELPCDDYEGVFVTVTDNCNDWTLTHADLHLAVVVKVVSSVLTLLSMSVRTLLHLFRSSP